MPTALWFAFGPFQLDTRNGQLLRHGQAIKLRPKTLAVLTFLAQRAGAVVNRTEIINAVWPNVVVQEEILTTSIAELRRALGDTRKSARYIETVHGRGVRFVADVRVSHSAEAAALCVEEPGFDERPTMPFVGREPALAELRRCLDEAFLGTTRVAVVRGPAGIGKTRLAREIAAIAAGRAAQVLQACADDERNQTVFWIWTQIVRMHADSCEPAELRAHLGSAAADIAMVIPSLQEKLGVIGPAPSLEPGLARARFFNGMTAFVRNLARHKPLVLLFDDLHKAGASSLALLRAVIDAPRFERVLVLITQRSGEEGNNPALTDLLESWQRAGQLTCVDLAGLNEAETRTLIASHTDLAVAPSLAQKIAKDTAGNPFFVLEIVTSLDDQTLSATSARRPAYEIPATLRRVIEDRLRRVGDDTHRFLRAAAVAGSSFDAHVAAAAALLTRDTSPVVAEALAAGILSESESSPAQLAFTHDLVRDTLLQGLAKLERATLHQRVGESLEERGNATPGNLMKLAHHFSRASSLGDVGKAVTYGLAAGRQALERYSNEEAFELLRRALELAEQSGRPPDDELFEILDQLTEAHVRLGRIARHAAQGTYEDAEAVADRLHSLASAQARPHWLAKSAMAIARSYMPYRQNISDKPILALEQALQALDDDTSLLYGHVAARLAAVLLGRADGNQRRIELARKAVAIARATGGTQEKLDLFHETLICFWDPDHLDERAQLTDELEEACRIAGNPYMMATSLTWRALNFMAMGRFRDAAATIVRTQALAADLQLDNTQRYAIRFRVHLEILRGRFDEAAQLTPMFSQLAPHANRATTQFEIMFADFAIKREKATLSEAADLIRAMAPQFPLFALRHSLPYFLVESGDREAARQELDVLAAHDFTDLPPRNEVVGWLPAIATLADACAELADATRAATLYRLLEPYAKQWAIVHYGIVIVGAVERCLARLAATMGAKERSVAHFDNVIAACEREGVVTELARAQLHYAQAIELGQRPGNAKSRQLRANALALAHAHGLEGIRRRAEK